MSETDPNNLLAQLGKYVHNDGQIPPVELWDPPFCGDMDMRIARDGTWYYLDSPIGRERLVRLFSTILRRDADGDYYLVTPVEKIRIQVEEAPFVAVLMEETQVDNKLCLRFITNVGDQVIADAEHPIEVAVDPVSREPKPLILVRRNLRALISRNLFYQLVAMAETRNIDGVDYLGIQSAGAFFPIDRLPEE